MSREVNSAEKVQSAGECMGSADTADLADLVIRIARKLQAAGPGEGGVELSSLEGMVMARVDDRPGVTPRELGAELRLRSSNMSAALRSLEAKGLICRSRDSVDGRVTRISPSPRAAENLSRLRGAWRQALEPVALRDSVVAVRLPDAVGLLRRINDGLN